MGHVFDRITGLTGYYSGCRFSSISVIPAQAGIQLFSLYWIPVFTGMTN